MDEIEMPRLIVRFHAELVPPALAARDVLARTDPQRWLHLVREHGTIELTPTFTALQPAALRDLQASAAQLDSNYQAEPLNMFFHVEAPESRNLAALAGLLRGWEVVRSAEIEVTAPDPLVNASDDTHAADQRYLDGAPGGIDARYAWLFPGGDGAGQRVVDVERGWTVKHEDLVAHGIPEKPLDGTIRDKSRGHGTSVLGVMVAVDNARGHVGIAPNVASVLTSSIVGSNRRDAIMKAIAKMRFGDVLLIESQVDGAIESQVDGATPEQQQIKQYGPVEMIEANYEAIRLATALGIVVIEVGGNGNGSSTPAVNLDTWANAAGRRVLWRDPANHDFRDSGAILVAAASPEEHTPLSYSTFGARIDCFGWGYGVATLSSNAAGATDLRTNEFDGTSAAAAMVAGAALCVQGLHEAKHQFRLSPPQMRAILSNPTLSTAPAATEQTAIGVMPDLRKIINLQLDISSDVYLRDSIADTGESPLTAISASPDVILRPAPVADPQAAYGQGSGTENNAALGFEADATQDNVIYVRVRNRGGSTATDVEARVFWAPVATLVTPDLWTLVGSVTIPSVPPGDILTVLGPITWPADKIPAPGQYSLVAILTTPIDPVPELTGFPDFPDFDNYLRFVRNNNNVAERSFNVVDANPDQAADANGFIDLPFLICGAPDRPRTFAVELALQLPPDGEALLEFPLRFVRDFDTQLLIESIDRLRGTGLARLPTTGRLRFGPARLDPGERYPMRIHARLPASAARANLVARQILNDGHDEVGRVTWILAPDVNARFEEARTGDPTSALG